MRNVLAKVAGLVAASALMLAAPVAARPGNVGPADNGPGDDNAPATTVRFSSVTYDVTDMTNYPTGKLTGTPVTGGAPITLRPILFAPDAYLKSDGFGDTPPDPVQGWDQAIDKLASLEGASPPPPPFAAIGNTQEVMKLAVMLPPKSIVVSYGPDPYDPKGLGLVTIQPVAQ